MKTVSNLVHIVDWFPTILNLANYKGDLPSKMDGVDQTAVLFDQKLNNDNVLTSARSSFIYGVLHSYENEAWTTNYAVRWGKYKYSNFIEPYDAYTCKFYNYSQIRGMYEPEDDSAYNSYLQTIRKKQSEKLGQEVNSLVDGVNKALALYDLSKDPFELNNLLGEHTVTQETFEMVAEINRYVMDTIGRDFAYPIQGYKNKAWDDLLQKMFRGLEGNKNRLMRNYLVRSGRMTAKRLWSTNALKKSQDVDFQVLTRFYEEAAKPREKWRIDLMTKTTNYFTDWRIQNDLPVMNRLINPALI